MGVNKIFSDQRAYFRSGATLPVKNRIETLKKFRRIIKTNEADFLDAVYKDLRKSSFEAYTTEIGQVYQEIDVQLRNVKKWSRRRRVPTNLINWPGRSFIEPHPLGVSLILGAWNYPYYVSLLPVVNALSAGNTVVLKPSEMAPNTSRLMARLFNHHFPSELFCVVEGGVEVSTRLLNEPWDKIFFTGSPRVGKIVMKAAAEHLSDVTLELGGKSPTIVTDSASIALAARRIIWGKYVNCGQTCVAPDYVLAHHTVKEDLLMAMKAEMEKMYGDSQNNPAYGRIVNDHHFSRLTNYLSQGTVYEGGRFDGEDRWIQPTILTDVDEDAPVMKEEIFGPVLPVLSYRTMEEAVSRIRSMPHPLALYLFSNKQSEQKEVRSRLTFGGMSINDTMVHIANPHLPFGGVGKSGLGSYHGKWGFDAFSHHSAILKKARWPDIPVKYPPHTDWKQKLVRLLFG